MAGRLLPLMLLPGHMCDARLFGPQLAALADRSVSVADLTDADSIAGMAQQVLASAPPHFALLGLSMGGIVAFEILRQAPQRVGRLALLDTNPFPESEDRSAGRLELMRIVAAGGLKPVVIEQLKPAYLARSNRDDLPLLSLIANMALELGPLVFDRQSRALLERPDSRLLLANIRMPTLVLCGREDALCPLAVHEMMAATIPGATLVVVDAAGHLPTLERPAAVNAAIHCWLNA